jgi:hypothetical protein
MNLLSHTSLTTQSLHSLWFLTTAEIWSIVFLASMGDPSVEDLWAGLDSFETELQGIHDAGAPQASSTLDKIEDLLRLVKEQEQSLDSLPEPSSSKLVELPKSFESVLPTIQLPSSSSGPTGSIGNSSSPRPHLTASPRRMTPREEAILLHTHESQVSTVREMLIGARGNAITDKQRSAIDRLLSLAKPDSDDLDELLQFGKELKERMNMNIGAPQLLLEQQLRLDSENVLSLEKQLAQRVLARIGSNISPRSPHNDVFDSNTDSQSQSSSIEVGKSTNTNVVALSASDLTEFEDLERESERAKIDVDKSEFLNALSELEERSAVILKIASGQVPLADMASYSASMVEKSKRQREASDLAAVDSFVDRKREEMDGRLREVEYAERIELAQQQALEKARTEFQAQLEDAKRSQENESLRGEVEYAERIELAQQQALEKARIEFQVQLEDAKRSQEAELAALRKEKDETLRAAQLEAEQHQLQQTLQKPIDESVLEDMKREALEMARREMEERQAEKMALFTAEREAIAAEKNRALELRMELERANEKMRLEMMAATKGKIGDSIASTSSHDHPQNKHESNDTVTLNISSDSNNFSAPVLSSTLLQNIDVTAQTERKSSHVFHATPKESIVPSEDILSSYNAIPAVSPIMPESIVGAPKSSSAASITTPTPNPSSVSPASPTLVNAFPRTTSSRRNSPVLGGAKIGLRRDSTDLTSALPQLSAAIAAADAAAAAADAASSQTPQPASTVDTTGRSNASPQRQGHIQVTTVATAVSPIVSTPGEPTKAESSLKSEPTKIIEVPKTETAPVSTPSEPHPSTPATTTNTVSDTAVVNEMPSSTIATTTTTAVSGSDAVSEINAFLGSMKLSRPTKSSSSGSLARAQSRNLTNLDDLLNIDFAGTSPSALPTSSTTTSVDDLPPLPPSGDEEMATTASMDAVLADVESLLGNTTAAGGGSSIPGGSATLGR